MKEINDPYIMIVGTMTSCQDCALVCNGKILIKLRASYQILNMILVLIGFCHVFAVEYHQDVREAIEFL